MLIKYHISKGKLVRCDAKIRNCPVAKTEEAHIYLQNEISSTTEMWEVLDKNAETNKNKLLIKNSFLALLSEEDEASARDKWYEMSGEVLYDKSLTAEEKKQTLQTYFDEASHPQDILRAMVDSRVFTTQEIDTAFFSMSHSEQYEGLVSVFGDWNWDKYARTDKELQKYLPVFSRKIGSDFNNEENVSTTNYAITDYVRSVAKYAKKDETLQKTAMLLRPLKASQYTYCNGFEQEELINNDYCSPKTAELILTNLTRSGNTNSFIIAATSVKERLAGNRDYSQRVSNYNAVLKAFEKVKPVAPLEGEPEPEIVSILAKKDQSYNSSSEHQGLYSVADSYKTNLDKLNRVPMYSRQDDEFKVVLSERARSARLKQSEHFRKTLAFYWQVKQELDAKKSKWV